MRFFRKRALPKPPSPQEALSSHEQLPSTGIALPTKATTDSMQHPTSASLPTVPGSPPSTPKFTRDILPSDLDKPAATNSAESKNTFFPPVPGSRPLPMQKPALSPQSPVAPWLSEEPSESARRTPPPPPPPPTPSVLPFRKMETTRNPLALSDSSTSSSDENKAIYNTQEPQAVKSPQISKKNQLRPKPKTEVPETAGAVIRQPVLPKKGISQQPAHLRRLSTEETSSGDDITGAVSVPRNKTSQRSQYNAEPMFTKAQRGVLDVPSPTRVKSKPVGSKMNSMPKIAKPTSSTAAAKKKTRRSSTGSESSSETSMLPTIQIKKVVLPSNIEQKRTPFLDSKGPEQQLIVHSKTSSRTGEVSSLTKPPPIISSLPLSKTERPNATTSYQESLSTSSSSTSSNESRSSRQKQSMEAQRAGKERYSKPVVVDTRLLDEEKKKPIPLTKTTRMLPTVSKKKPRDTIRPVKPTRDVLDITKVREDQEITSTERMDTKTTLQQESASIVEEIKQLRDQLASEVLRMETTLRNTPSDIAPVTLTNELDEGNFAYIAGWRELTSGITQPSTPSISFKELELAAQHLITVCRVAQRMLDRYKGVNAQKSFDDESQRLRAYLSQCVPIPVAVRTASHAIQKGRALQILHALELLHKNQALRYAFRTLLYNVRMTGDEVYGSHVPVGIVEQLRKDQCRLLSENEQLHNKLMQQVLTRYDTGPSYNKIITRGEASKELAVRGIVWCLRSAIRYQCRLGFHRILSYTIQNKQCEMRRKESSVLRQLSRTHLAMERLSTAIILARTRNIMHFFLCLERVAYLQDVTYVKKAAQQAPVYYPGGTALCTAARPYTTLRRQTALSGWVIAGDRRPTSIEKDPVHWDIPYYQHHQSRYVNKTSPSTYAALINDPCSSRNVAKTKGTPIFVLRIACTYVSVSAYTADLLTKQKTEMQRVAKVIKNVTEIVLTVTTE